MICICPVFNACAYLSFRRVNQRDRSYIPRSRSSRSFTEATGSFFRSSFSQIKRLLSIGPPTRKRKCSDLCPEVAEHNTNGEFIHRPRRRRTNNYEMNSLQNNDLEIAEEAQTLNQNNDDVEEGLDATRIQISSESPVPCQLQVNEVSSTTASSELAQRPHMNFPFLIDDNTISWIRSNHVMFIMRGLSGSGKSTLVKAIKSIYAKDATGDFVICSADNFFMSNGSYNFDISRISDAHDDCQNRMKEAVTSRVRTVVIDNTNVMYWEMKTYFQNANKEGYHVILVEPKTPWRLNADILAEKNSHGVSKEVLQKKVRSYNSIVPLYYGWFLSSYDGKRLLDLSKSLLQLCLQKCDKFQSDFQEFSSMINLPSQLNYYSRPHSKDSQISNKLHCTAKFCGKARKGNYSDDAMEYVSNQEVIASHGLLSKLSVIGFVFSKGTFGARVKLSEIQLELYGQNDDELRCNKFNSSTSKVNSSFEYVGAEEHENLENMSSIEKTTNFNPIPNKGRRAHITLGTADGVAPVQTGFDLLEAVDFEKNALKEKLYYNIFTFRIPETQYVLRRYRHDLWVLYTAAKNISYDAIFTANYT